MIHIYHVTGEVVEAYLILANTTEVKENFCCLKHAGAFTGSSRKHIQSVVLALSKFISFLINTGV